MSDSVDNKRAEETKYGKVVRTQDLIDGVAEVIDEDETTSDATTPNYLTNRWPPPNITVAVSGDGVQ